MEAGSCGGSRVWKTEPQNWLVLRVIWPSLPPPSTSCLCCLWPTAFSALEGWRFYNLPCHLFQSHPALHLEVLAFKEWRQERGGPKMGRQQIRAEELSWSLEMGTVSAWRRGPHTPGQVGTLEGEPAIWEPPSRKPCLAERRFPFCSTKAVGI